MVDVTKFGWLEFAGLENDGPSKNGVEFAGVEHDGRSRRGGNSSPANSAIPWIRWRCVVKLWFFRSLLRYWFCQIGAYQSWGKLAAPFGHAKCRKAFSWPPPGSLPPGRPLGAVLQTPVIGSRSALAMGSN